MPWNNVSTDEGKMSEFNSAGLKMVRLDKLQQLFNEINTNLSAFNEMYGVYNYQLKISLCDSLYLETESKLTKEEREEATEIRNKVEIFIKSFPIHKKIKQKVYPYKVKQQLSMEAFEVLKKLLFEYEKLARKLIDNHGMDTLYEEDALF